VDEAVDVGCELSTQTRVDRVLVEDGQVVGVEGSRKGRSFKAFAETVILAAGGIGSPRILQASGFDQAGQGMTMDITVMVYGTSPETGIGKEPPMTWSWENQEVGYMLSSLIDPWLLYPLINMLKGPKYALTWPRWSRTLGVMIKLKDDISGGIISILKTKTSSPLLYELSKQPEVVGKFDDTVVPVMYTLLVESITILRLQS